MLFKPLDRRSGDLLIRGLATWRVAHMLVHEIGPYGIFTKVRQFAGIEHDSEGYPSVWSSRNVLSCVWCTSVWVGLVALFLPKWLVELLSLSAIACMLEEKYGKS